MTKLLALLLLFLLLIAPVTVRLDVRLLPAPEAVIVPRVWGLGPELRFRLADHRPVRVDRQGRVHPLRTGTGGPKPPLSAILEAAAHLELLRLDIALSMGLGDAARTALMTGGLQSLWYALPERWRRRARFQVRPDFLGGQGCLQARCMVFCRLGTLLYTALMLFISTRRPEPWNIPSAN